jgi:hypothetical protein
MQMFIATNNQMAEEKSLFWQQVEASYVLRQQLQQHTKLEALDAAQLAHMNTVIFDLQELEMAFQGETPINGEVRDEVMEAASAQASLLVAALAALVEHLDALLD